MQRNPNKIGYKGASTKENPPKASACTPSKGKY